jgi:hypothetical protein
LRCNGGCGTFLRQRPSWQGHHPRHNQREKS